MPELSQRRVDVKVIRE